MFMRKKRSGNGMLMGTLIGGVIGATGALLLAPKKGEELRQDIRKQFEQSEQGKNVSHMLLEMGSEWTADLFDEMNSTDKTSEKQDNQHQNQNDHYKKNEQSSANNTEQDGGDIGKLIHEVVEDESLENDDTMTKGE
ncbi:YtxH domain-containing protein [Bacillus alkalicellulosilyticus]|uniref:YtxH domain-containing protein n=1 Tax=Alkalihalobacterium alkalicellulosilyticum TaxID=1912214 RepID=UPI000998AEE3|nr:YtxH domain-containing protein [Bacillus alkalicellulosilyticus]